MRTRYQLPHTRLLIAAPLALACATAGDAAQDRAQHDSAQSALTARDGAPRTATFVPADSLVAIAPMAAARAAHTATALPDGRVLLAGGLSAVAHAETSAELYDPATGRFAVAAPMRTPRHSHTATLLVDGTVLLTGGYDAAGAYLASAERFDPATGRFTSTGAMGVARESHVAALLRDGRVLVVGGHHGRGAEIRLLDSAELYDPRLGRWTSTGSMAIRRHKHDAVTLRDGRVLVTGGTDERDDRGRYASTELYHPATARFAPAGELRLPRYKHQGTSILLPDGRVLVAGGAERAELYDVTANRFTLVGGSARMPGQFSAAAALRDGRVLVSGGYGNGGGPVASAWMYRLSVAR